MTLNNFIKMVGTFEGFRSHAYYDLGGTLTIGYGFTKSVIDTIHPDMTMEKTLADKLLKKIIKSHVEKVYRECKKHNLMFTCNQVLALTDFEYNCGFGALQNILKQETHDNIKEHLIMYNKVTINGTKKTVQGLVNRREWEVELYNKKCSCNVPCSYKD